MPLQTSGAISLNQIHVEAGGSSGTQASLNDSDIRGLIGKSSGAQMSFNEWYGAASMQYSLTSPQYYWLVGGQGNQIYWNGSVVGTPSSSATSHTAGGFTYTRGTLQETQTFKNNTFYYYKVARSA